MNRKRNPAWAFSVRQRGFSMAEVLVVMAIIMILSGIAVPTGTRVLNNVRQMSLNRAAETIYMTAQRNLIAAKLAGKSPGDSSWSAGDKYDADFNINSSGAYMITSDDRRLTTDTPPVLNPSAAINIVMPAQTVNPSWSGQKWKIRYNDAFQVIEVYYSEDVELQNLKKDYDSGAVGKVGHYG